MLLAAAHSGNHAALRGADSGWAPPSATAPVLTKTSSAGANPMRWSSAYVDLYIDEDGIADGVNDDYITCRWRIDGGSWTNETNVLFDSEFYLEHGIDAVTFPWPLFDAQTFTAGQLVEAQEGILRAGVTTWSNTVSDTMAATDVTFSYGDKATSAASSTDVSFLTKAFAGGGRAWIFLTCFSNAGGSTDSVPTSLTITPSAGGAGINCTLLGSGGRAASRVFAVYRSDSNVSATNYDITGTRPNAARSNVIMWGTGIGANATPTSGPTFNSGSSTNPQLTSSLTVVANGLAIGAFMLENNVTVAANAGTAVLDQTYFNSECGLALATRTTTGTLSVNADPAGSYNWSKGIVAFGP